LHPLPCRLVQRARCVILQLLLGRFLQWSRCKCMHPLQCWLVQWERGRRVHPLSRWLVQYKRGSSVRLLHCWHLRVRSGKNVMPLMRRWIVQYGVWLCRLPLMRRWIVQHGVWLCRLRHVWRGYLRLGDRRCGMPLVHSGVVRLDDWLGDMPPLPFRIPRHRHRHDHMPSVHSGLLHLWARPGQLLILPAGNLLKHNWKNNLLQLQQRRHERNLQLRGNREPVPHPMHEQLHRERGLLHHPRAGSLDLNLSVDHDLDCCSLNFDL
jgi:hypothetical protein